jgi:hypothetical protein
MQETELNLDECYGHFGYDKGYCYIRSKFPNCQNTKTCFHLSYLIFNVGRENEE